MLRNVGRVGGCRATYHSVWQRSSNDERHARRDRLYVGIRVDTADSKKYTDQRPNTAPRTQCRRGYRLARVAQ